jgi:methylmalonyl-CoA mutase
MRLDPSDDTTEAERWRKRVEDAVGQIGSSQDALSRLVHTTSDGLAIEPLYPPAPIDEISSLAGRAPWLALARLDNADPAVWIVEARADFAAGAQGLDLVFAGSSCAFGFGLRPLSRAVAARLAADVEAPADAVLQIGCPPLSGDEAAAFFDLWRDACEGSGFGVLRFDFDPAVFPEDRLRALAAGADRAVDALFCADGRRVHAGGGSEAQELAFVLASAVAALRAGEAAGVSTTRLREQLFFRLAADADLIATVAKLRALRLLWPNVEQACGLAPRPIVVHADTAWRMMTRLEPWTNVARTTIAAAAAAIGGADSISVLPFTRALGLPDAEARRLAVATKVILLQEAGLAQAADATEGAGVFARLTPALAERAWSLFQDIERKGGIARVRASGSLRAAIAAVRTAREKAISGMLDRIVGTTLSVAAPGADVRVLAAAPDVQEPSSAETPLWRAAEGFERLRAHADARLAATGAPVRAFVAQVGTSDVAVEGAAFAKSLFEAGGFETICCVAGNDPLSTTTPFRAAGACFACLAVGPGIDAETARALEHGLMGVGARLIFRAGASGELGSADISRDSDIVLPGCDGLEILRRAHACSE